MSDNIPWGFVVIIGPILLGLVLFWALMKNRKARPGEKERAEAGARELRDKIERDDARHIH